jgi:hypothetical protein
MGAPVTISDTAIAAGWYTDPAGPNSLRWWDGVQWTGLVQPDAQNPVPAPPVVRGPFELPASSAPRVDPYSIQTSYYSTAQRNGPVNNTWAWFGFGAGIAAMLAVVLKIGDPGLGFYLPVFGITAISASIRALFRYRRGSVTVLWAPILGIVLGTIAELILIPLLVVGPTVGNTVGSSVGNPVVTGTQLGVSPADTINYSMGQGRIVYSPSGNATLTTVANQEFALVSKLAQVYQPGSYPSALHLDSTGAVVASDGTVLGDYLQPGWFIQYNVQADGTYMLEMTGQSTDEVAVYYSGTNQYWAWCGTSDTSCKTGSPAPPSTSQTPNFVSGSPS